MTWDPEAATPALATEGRTDTEHQQQHCQPAAIKEVLAEQVWPIGTTNFMLGRCQGLGYGTWVVVQSPGQVPLLTVKVACSEINAK